MCACAPGEPPVGTDLTSGVHTYIPHIYTAFEQPPCTHHSHNPEDDPPSHNHEDDLPSHSHEDDLPSHSHEDDLPSHSHEDDLPSHNHGACEMSHK